MPIVVEQAEEIIVVTVYVFLGEFELMKIKYDPKVDAAYIPFKKRPVEVTKLRIIEDIAIDFGPAEEILSIEVLDASKHLELSREHPRIELENLACS
jgi:uncharacterized protein YuzE